MLKETIISSRRMKEHPRSKGGAENVVISESMLNQINDAKRKDDERLRKRKRLRKMQGGCRNRKKKSGRKEYTGRYNKIKKDIGRKRERERAMVKEEKKLNEDFEVV